MYIKKAFNIILLKTNNSKKKNAFRQMEVNAFIKKIVKHKKVLLWFLNE